MASFRDWLKDHRNDNSPVGDLARDVLDDTEWPKGRGSLKRYRAHLESCGAIPEAIDTLETAWDRYTSDTMGEQR